MDEDVRVEAAEVASDDNAEKKECCHIAEEVKTVEAEPVKKTGNLGLFTMSLLSIILPGLVGVILGIIALVKSNARRKTEESELVGASFVMSIVGIVLSVAAMIAFVAAFGIAVAAVSDIARSFLYYNSYWWL